MHVENSTLLLQQPATNDQQVWSNMSQERAVLCYQRTRSNTITVGDRINHLGQVLR